MFVIASVQMILSRQKAVHTICDLYCFRRVRQYMSIPCFCFINNLSITASIDLCKQRSMLQDNCFISSHEQIR